MKKTLTILTIIMMVMSAIIVFAAPTGDYSPNGYFYKPDYGASGIEEWETYNTYIDKADAQIEANKDAFANYYLKTEIDTLSEMELIWGKDVTDSTELATALSDYYLKTAIDSQTEMEAIWGVSLTTDDEWNTLTEIETATASDIVDATELSTYCETTQDYLKTSENNDTADDLSDNSINDLSDVDTTGKAVGKLLKFDASGNLIVGDDETGGGGGYTNLTSFVDQTAWRLFYSDGNGDVTELAFGDSGKYLKSNGATAAPSWDTPAGGGGATAFTDLTDTPANYTGSANKFLQVNATPDAIIFDTISTADLSDKDNVAMLNENEDVTGLWSFNSSIFAYIKSNDALACPSIYLERYRAGDTSVISGDKLGSILYVGYNESCGQAYGAFIDAIVDGTPDCDDLPTRLEFGTTNDGESWPSLRMAIDSSGNIKMGDGAWTNYVNISNAGVLTFEGTASINEPLSILASTTSAELAGVISDETGTGALVFANSPSLVTPALGTPTSGDLSNCTGVLHNIVEDTTPKLGGELDAGAHTIGFTQQTVTYNATTTTVDWKLGNKASLTLTGNVGTLDFVNPSNPCNILLKIVQDATGSRTITNWDADIKWAGGGTAPTLSTGANAIDIVTFYFDGTYYYGVASLDFQ